MKSIRRRIETIEQKSGIHVPRLGSITHHFVSPGPDGPVDSGCSQATILTGPNRGLKLDREPGESREAFALRVSALVDAA